MESEKGAHENTNCTYCKIKNNNDLENDEEKNKDDIETVAPGKYVEISEEKDEQK